MSDQAPSPRGSLSKLKQQLAQREAELAILNDVQNGFAAHLEVQAIYDLVGDGIRDLFDSQVVMISTYDPPRRPSSIATPLNAGSASTRPGRTLREAFARRSSKRAGRCW